MVPLRKTYAWNFLTTREDRVRAAYALIESAIRRHDVGVEEWYLDQRSELDPAAPEHELVDSLYAEQKSDSTYHYPQILRASVFFSAFGVFERFMDLLCIAAREYKGSKLSHKDLHGRGIRRARSYLVKVGEIDFPDTSDWQKLDGHRELRNALVHSHGDLTESSRLQQLIQLETSVGTFRISESRRSVDLFEVFNPGFVDVMMSFASELEERWPN